MLHKSIEERINNTIKGNGIDPLTLSQQNTTCRSTIVPSKPGLRGV